ncbi:MAG: ADP-ribosylation factor-like protein [Promethearchaeota archaeon]
MVEPKYLKKILPFFKEGVDFSKIKKPTDVLDLELKDLKDFDPNWEPFFEEVDEDLKTIKDLAKSQDDLVIEGLNPDETRKLAIIAEMIFWHMTQIAEYGEKQKKIVFFGLNNAGKTSLLTALSEKYSTIKEILPTRGLSRQQTNIFGYQVSSYDMGGQEEYRKNYFEKADMYFSETDILVYCIDIQDKDRYDESLEYLKKILDTYKKYNLSMPVLIAFTKFDPDLINDEGLNANRINLIDKIEKICDDFEVGYVNSSIFERNSIENLFSLSLKRVSTSGGVIQEFLELFTKNIEARAACLISSTGLVYGTYGETHQEEEMLKNSAAYLQNLYLFHITQQGSNIQKEDFYELHYTRNNLHFVSEYITNTENDSGMVYLWILTNNLRNEILGIPKFREDLLPLIELFL